MVSSRAARRRRRRWRKKTSRKKQRAEKAASALVGMGESRHSKREIDGALKALGEQLNKDVYGSGK